MGPLADAIGVQTVGLIASAVSAAICLAILGNKSLRGLR